jgi:hypothetical protein
MEMNMKTLAFAVGLAVGSIGMVGVAQAVPMLEITQGATNPATPLWPNAGPLAAAPSNPSPPVGGSYGNNAEAIGDNGGTNYTNGPTAGATNGPGMPTALGGWPTPAPGFAPDPSFGNNMGISGWDASYLNLTQASNVTFQFMGKGDAADHNQFWAYVGNTWTMLWDNQSASNGTCGVTGTSPNCPFAGSQQTYFFDAGLIPFYFVNLSSGGTATNDGSNNPSPDFIPGQQTFGGYFLGMDPYLAGGPFTNTGSATYIGFTDRGCDGASPSSCDHDYEDLIVRASVPEPGSIFLLGAGLLGLAGLRRRKA